MRVPFPSAVPLALAAALVSARGSVDGAAPPPARFRVEAPRVVEAGTVFEVSVTADEDVARDLPLRIDWTAATNLDPEGRRLGWRDVADPSAARPRIVARVRAGPAAGPAVLEGHGRYHVCRGDTCILHAGPVRVAVTVVPPAAR